MQELNQEQVDQVIDAIIAEWFVWSQEMRIPWRMLGINKEPSAEAIALVTGESTKHKP